MNARSSTNPTVRAPAGSRRALGVALALAALGTPGCGDDSSSDAASKAASEAAHARAATAEAMSIVTTYPVRDIYVAFQPRARDGVAPPRRSEAEALSRAREIAARLRVPGASFAAIAEETSDDPSTSTSEGFVGFVSRLTGEDEKLVAKVATLAVGEISEPIPGKGGLHVAQRLSRDEGKALEARVFVPYEGLLIPSTARMRGIPATQTEEWVRAESLRALGELRNGTSTLEKLAEPISGSRVLRDVVRGAPNPGYEPFARTMRAAPSGTWLDPIDIPDGVVIARRIPYVRASVRHLVVTHVASPKSRRVTPRLTEDAEHIARDAKARLDRDPASWDRVVAEVSEEPGTKDAGGFMGDVANTTLLPKRYPPELENAVWKLAPGETSDVVATRFGFHIFRRID